MNKSFEERLDEACKRAKLKEAATTKEKEKEEESLYWARIHDYIIGA